MNNYYAQKLGAQKLLQVYETKIPRIQQYLQEEVNFIKKNLTKTQNVLELGAGYGRIIKELAPHCNSIVGIDISKDSIVFGREYLKEQTNACMIEMDVHQMTFTNTFDVIVCLQNGLSAMNVDYTDINKILEILTPGGIAFFSSYSEKIWDYRIKWFEEQASKGLVGKIDYDKTKDGVIVCQDGFKASTYSPRDLQKIGKQSGYSYNVQEIDESSIFLIIYKK